MGETKGGRWLLGRHCCTADPGERVRWKPQNKGGVEPDRKGLDAARELDVFRLQGSPR